MKFTKYFEYRREKSDRKLIRDEWIQSVIDAPEAKQIQSDGRIKLWGKIGEASGRYLRVILLPDGVTVHNAFFDRDFEARRQ